jgi:hypothetical protein
LSYIPGAGFYGFRMSDQRKGPFNNARQFVFCKRFEKRVLQRNLWVEK